MWYYVWYNRITVGSWVEAVTTYHERGVRRMNVFNRIVMILGILIWLFLLALVLVVLLTEPLMLVDWLNQASEAVEAYLFNVLLFRYIVLAIAIALLALLILLIFELSRRRSKTVKVRQVGSGDAQLSVVSISQNLRHQIGSLSGIVRVKPRVTSRGKAVDVVLDLETSPDVHVPSKTDQALQVARTVVEEKLGIKLRRITANIKQSPLPKTSKEPSAPTVSLPAVEPPSAEADSWVPVTGPSDVVSPAEMDRGPAEVGPGTEQEEYAELTPEAAADQLVEPLIDVEEYLEAQDEPAGERFLEPPEPVVDEPADETLMDTEESPSPEQE